MKSTKTDLPKKEEFHETPSLNVWLHSIEEEARQRNYPALFIAVSDPSHPLGGGSLRYTSDHVDKELYEGLAEILMLWENHRGINSKHDWRKESVKELKKKLFKSFRDVDEELDRELDILISNKEKNKKR